MAEAKVRLLQCRLEPGLLFDDVVGVAVPDVLLEAAWREEPVVAPPVAVLSVVDIDAVQRQRDLGAHRQIVTSRPRSDGYPRPVGCPHRTARRRSGG